jgi:FKBP-type peptidyl-prolyl cis-trans isomerase (trigger factor)
VETLIKDLAIDASEEDINKELDTAVAESGESMEEVKKYYEKEGMKEALQDSIKEQKLFELLLTGNQVKTGPAQTYLEFSSNYR